MEVVKRENKNDTHKKGGHDVPFKPAKTINDKSEYKASYDHMVDRVDVVKNFRDKEGNVETDLRNFYTTPPRKGKVGRGTTFSPLVAHMPDEYDFAKEIAK